MPNDQSFDTRTTNPANRSVQAVGLSVSPVVVAGIPEANLLVDTFESADFSSPTSPLPSKNTIGFEWYNLTATSIVRDDQYVVNNGSPILTGPISGRQWENGPGETGQHSMRFRYGAGNNMVEISFRFASYRTEVWFRYWWRVPINFVHGTLNNKFFSIFPTRATYDELGTLTIQTRPDGSGGANLVYQDGGVVVGEEGSTAFASSPADQGRWMQVVMRFKRASSSSANDGAYQFWRRWEGDSDFSLIHSKTNAQLYNDTDPNGFKEGYVMGYANDPYDVDTEFLMDDFEISDQPLVPDGTEGL